MARLIVAFSLQTPGCLHLYAMSEDDTLHFNLLAGRCTTFWPGNISVEWQNAESAHLLSN